MHDIFKNLRRIAPSYIGDNLDPDVRVVREYTKYDIAIGVTKFGKVVYLDVRESCRCISIGRTRTGKSFFLRGFSDRLKKSKYGIVFLPDPKNEYASSNKPVQEKFVKGLLKDEMPTPQEVISLRPTFFKLYRDFLPSNNLWFSVPYNKLSASDFLTLFKSDELSVTQNNILQELLYNLLERKDEELGLEEIESMIMNCDVGKPTKQSLLMSLRLLRRSNFYVEGTGVDVVKLIREGKSLALNVQFFEDFEKSRFRFPEVVFSVVLKELIDARRNNLIPPLWVLVDEARTFLPRNYMTSSRELVEKSVKLDAKYGVNYFFAAQEFRDIPEELISQCRYIFVPYNAELSDFVFALRRAGLIRQVLTQTNDALKIKSSMSQYDWLLVDTNMNTKVIFKPLSPLSFHDETTI